MSRRQGTTNLQPINQIFKFLQSKIPVCIWLFENKATRFRGQIIGFDEFMNLTLDNAVEVNTKTGEEVALGRILLKGDAVCVVHQSDAAPSMMQE